MAHRKIVPFFFALNLLQSNYTVSYGEAGQTV